MFAKLSPAQKARIIDALHRKGHVVGFLGDGINDGPALKAADVGISVDTAVDIAKESADIILLEKSLLVLEEGVLEGRKVFGNIIKYIKMGASSNFGNMFSVLGRQHFPAVPADGADPGADQQPALRLLADDHPDRRRGRGVLAAAARAGTSATSRVHALHRADQLDLRLRHVLHDALRVPRWDNAALFQTGWFVESLLTQTLIIHIIRTGKIPFLQSRASWPLMVTTIGICLIGAWLPFSHFAPALGFTPLPPGYWLALLVILGCYLGLTQLVKTWLIRRFGLS